jgi:hypothetical protein
MRREDWEQAVARAVVERAFRVRLLSDPADALFDYGLPESEAGVVRWVRARSLEQLAAHLTRLVPDAALTSPPRGR